MRKRTRFAAGLLALTLVAGTCLAQAENPKPAEGPKGFQLDFVLKELEDGKVASSRNYSMMVSAVNNNGSIRAGDKVPVTTKSGSASEFTYLDVGVNIDCRGVMESQGKLHLTVTADISTVAPDSNASRPVIRSTKWTSGVDVPYRKSTVLFSSDDASSKRRLQLELTASPIN